MGLCVCGGGRGVCAFGWVCVLGAWRRIRSCGYRYGTWDVGMLPVSLLHMLTMIPL